MYKVRRPKHEDIHVQDTMLLDHQAHRDHTYQLVGKSCRAILPTMILLVSAIFRNRVNARLFMNTED